MTHFETNRIIMRRAAFVAASISCALFAIGCSVYDASLLEGPLVGAGAGGKPSANGGSPSIAGTGNAGDPNETGDAGDGNSMGGATSGSAGTAGTAGEPTSVAGASGSGGSPGGGAGGSPAGGAPNGGAGSVLYSMIDDMENPDLYIPNTDDRQGFWSLANDGTVGGKQGPSPLLMSPIPGGRDGSVNAFHTTASGFSTSGAWAVIDLNRKGATRATYDASAYKGLHFWAKVDGSSPVDVHLAMLDVHTDPAGKLCCTAANACAATGGNIANGLCYDHFTRDLTLTKAWAEYTINFTGMSQLGWGDNNVTAVDAAKIYAIQISWTSAAMDLWIDDIAFVKK